LRQTRKVGIVIKLTYPQARCTTITKEYLTAAVARKWEWSLQALIYKGVADITAVICNVANVPVTSWFQISDGGTSRITR